LFSRFFRVEGQFFHCVFCVLSGYFDVIIIVFSKLEKLRI
jgi:hypothetical protein